MAVRGELLVQLAPGGRLSPSTCDVLVLAGFFVRGGFAAPLAELLEFDAVAGVRLVL